MSWQLRKITPEQSGIGLSMVQIWIAWAAELHKDVTLM